MKPASRVWLAAVALALCASPAPAGIERLDLAKMLERAETALHGEITSARVFRAFDERTSTPFYFTLLVIVGESLLDGSPLTQEVTVYGGYLSEEEGASYSEAPAADDIRVGNTVVGFTKWTDDMGAGVAGHCFYASHGGVYRVVVDSKDSTVLGRGAGYAIERNVKLSSLRSSISEVQKERIERERK